VATEHDSESPIRLAAGRRRHPIDDLLLQHEVHVLDAGVTVQQTKQQRRRDVVGQVADNAQPVAQATVVEFQCIGLVDADVRLAVVFLAQGTGQVAIDFDAVQVPGCSSQRRRDGAMAGPDFDYNVVGPWSDRADDGFDYARVRQEMLAEALARAVFRHDPESSDAATSSAALRLPGSAMPRPAMSRAVP
jgi:hypothetical protein